MQTIIVNIINNRKFDQLLRTAALWVAPSLACGFVARRSQPHCGGCSLLAPRHRPNWAQQNTSHLGDTTLEPVAKVRFVQERRCPHPRTVRKTPATFPRMWASALLFCHFRNLPLIGSPFEKPPGPPRYLGG